VNGDAMPDSENIPGDTHTVDADAAETKPTASDEPDQKAVEKSKSLHDEIEALIAGKVRSISNPRSG
jgi:hypothetical protein